MRIVRLDLMIWREEEEEDERRNIGLEHRSEGKHRKPTHIRFPKGIEKRGGERAPENQPKRKKENGRKGERGRKRGKREQGRHRGTGREREREGRNAQREKNEPQGARRGGAWTGPPGT